ncbi:hypothetical protein [Shivajiella indica]|uniref:Outer membrane protein beta-barrel domain-containing protein n=1 Tax=Shivajiella indica TaxID=872115 RepID=A0ABW5B2E4_9BACT
MKEQFDKRLVEKIKDSFDNHEESFDPKAWENFSAAYFKPKNSTAKYTWILWVASFALVLGFTILFFSQENKIAEQELATLTNEMNTGTSDSQDSLIMNQATVSEIGDDNKLKLTEVIQNKNSKETLERGEIEKEPVSQFALAELEEKKIMVETTIETSEGTLSPSDQERDLNKPLVSDLRVEEEIQANELIQEWFYDGLDKDNKKELVTKDTKKAVKLGVLLAPQTISNSNQAMNLGAGFMSEFTFSKRLKLDLGVAYANQNITPGGTNLRNVMASQSEDASRAANMTMSNNLINTDSELKFGQLEVPINLKFMVMDKEASGLYLVSGVSSMVYVNQRSIITYNAVNLNTSGSLSSQNMVQTFSETLRPTEENSGSNVGQMINFGLGYEHNLKNGTFVSFEPFFKTSVGSQTFLGQQFSIGGINLRMNFQLKK